MDITAYLSGGKKTSAVLACGGVGSRMGENKLLIRLCGKSVIRRSAEVLCSCPDIEKIIIPAPPELWQTYKKELAGLPVPVVFCEAGRTRAQSVRNAVEFAEGDLILIHDGARPLVSESEIKRSVDDACKCGSSVVCTPVKDTLRFCDGEKSFCPDRSRLYTVRTPQTFSLSLYRYALLNANGDFTDDAQLLDAIGVTPHITLGEYRNIKLTTREDISVAEEYLGGKTMRIGQGYDVHRLAEDRELILGGVKIDCEKGLLGHSDADVLVHAIMDALLGAAALGDIGKLFPDTDPKYKGANSIKLLEAVAGLLNEEGYTVSNIDATVVAQAPKLAPYIQKMRENIAKAANTDVSRVSVKATTEEGLGFSGRKEGIAAQAVAAIF